MDYAPGGSVVAGACTHLLFVHPVRISMEVVRNLPSVHSVHACIVGFVAVILWC